MFKQSAASCLGAGATAAGKKVCALLLALLLCLGAVPTVAWADTSGSGTSSAAAQSAGSATLSIVKGVSSYSGPNALVNEVYQFTEGATVGDLLEAAKKAGDIADYKFSDSGYGSYLNSITLSDGTVLQNTADYSSWWSIYKNGTYASGTAGQESDALANGDAIQFAWCDSYPNVDPTTAQWETLKGSATASGTVAGTTTPSPSEIAGLDSATLSIVKGVSSYSGSNALVNKTYQFTEGATVGDLLEAAKKAGDIADYKFSDSGYGSYLNSVTLSDGTVLQNTASYSSWWSIYKNGTYASGTAGQESDALANGDAIQFAWCDSYPNVDPTTAQWETLKGSATASGTVAGTVVPSKPGSSGSQESNKVDTADLDKSLNATYRSLFKSLTALCKGSGGASERNVRSWQAMEAAAIGQLNLTDKDAAIAEAVSAYKNKTTDLSRCIIVLTALGVDATKVPSSEGPIDLVERLANDSAAITGYPTSSAFALLAYACGSYDVPENAVNSPRKLIDELVAAQASDGSYKSMGSVDVDTTAMVIPALAAYQDDAAAQGALSKAVSALRAQKKKDGSFGNVNSTSVAIVAFASAGVDPSSEKVWGKNTPLRALLNMANDDLSGFKVSQGMQEDMANEQGFRALVAYQGMKNTKTSYNIYTQAKDGQAGLSGAASGGSSAGADSDADNANDNSGGNTDTKQDFVSDLKPAEVQGDTLSQTSDGTTLYAGILAAIVLGSLVTSVTTSRSLRPKKETMLHR